jgi:hypothetical protein
MIKKMFEFSSEFMVFTLVFLGSISIALLLIWIVIALGGRLIDG